MLKRRRQSEPKTLRQLAISQLAYEQQQNYPQIQKMSYGIVSERQLREKQPLKIFRDIRKKQKIGFDPYPLYSRMLSALPQPIRSNMYDYKYQYKVASSERKNAINYMGKKEFRDRGRDDANYYIHLFVVNAFDDPNIKLFILYKHNRKITPSDRAYIGSGGPIDDTDTEKNQRLKEFFKDAELMGVYKVNILHSY